MKTLPTGFPVALCTTAIQFSDQHSNRSFLLLRIVDFLIDVVDVLDVSVSEIAAFPSRERLAFQGIVSMRRQILVAVEEVFGGPSAFKRRIQCLAFCNRSAFVAERSCLSRAMRSKSMTSLSPTSCSANDFRYSSCSNHLERIV